MKERRLKDKQREWERGREGEWHFGDDIRRVKKRRREPEQSKGPPVVPS